jgi:hypothetical protein
MSKNVTQGAFEAHVEREIGQGRNRHDLRFAVFSYLLGRATWITVWFLVGMGVVIGIVGTIAHGGSR